MQCKVTPGLRLEISGVDCYKNMQLCSLHAHPENGKPAPNPRHGHTQVEAHRKRRRADAETDSDRR